MGEQGGEGFAISLPASLSSLTGLASLLLGRQSGSEVSEAAKMLGIKWQPSSKEPKLEVNSGEENEDKKDFEQDSVKERKVPKLKQTPHKNKELKQAIIKYSQGSSGESSNDDDSDYEELSSPAKRKRKMGQVNSKKEGYEFRCEDCDLQLRTDYLMKRHNLNKHDSSS